MTTARRALGPAASGSGDGQVSRILVIRRGGLGDTLLLAPLLRALRRRYGGAAIHVAGTREHCDVLAGFGIVDVAHSAERFQLWLPERAREQLRSFDLVLGDEPACVDVALEPTQVLPGIPFGLQLCRQAGLDREGPEVDWPEDGWLVRAPAPAAGPRQRAAVTLAPGSGGVHKCWARAHWLQLAQALADRGRDVCVLVGPVESERGADNPRIWPWPSPATMWIDEPLPLGAAKRLQDAQQFVGNDSGPTHLAAALGVPTLALFVATDPAVWAPVGPHVRVLGEAGAPPSVAAVLASLDSR
ncbi:MAG: glycosyltransferase family 9 protein [Planctomycetota bacterium]